MESWGHGGYEESRDSSEQGLEGHSTSGAGFQRDLRSKNRALGPERGTKAIIVGEGPQGLPHIRPRVHFIQAWWCVHMIPGP